MKKARILANHNHGKKWGADFAKGLQRHGFEITEGESDLLVLWGVRDQDAINRQRSRGEVCILECGFIGNRLQWSSASLGGGLNGRGRFGPCQDAGARFSGLSQLSSWNDGRGCALIMGQVPGDMSIRGIDVKAEYASAIRQCRSFGYEVHFRPHPQGPIRIEGVTMRPDGEPLVDALDAAAFVVTVNSNSGVDAALAGVPVVALDRGSMAWAVASREIGALIRPSRLDWAAHLAWKQWNREEFARGDAWAALEAA